LDVLSLIPTHLGSQKDRFRASRVCRVWRRTLLQHTALWSLILPKGKVYIENLLERTKEAPLDIITHYGAPVGTTELLFPHAQRIKYLNFMYNCWSDVQRFSEANSGPLPLLYTLEINADVDSGHAGRPDPTTPPSLPLFTNAVNLKRFVLRSRKSPFLNHFVFPNLTTFKLSVAPAEEGFRAFRALELLDFLEASPVLQNVDVGIAPIISLEDVAQGRVVTLPNVKTFALGARNGAFSYKLAAHISCPSASSTSLTREGCAKDMIPGRDTFMFPTAASWNAIVRQYTRSPVEVVTLKIDPPQDFTITCTLAFRSLDMTVINFCLRIKGGVEDRDEFQMTLGEIALEAFSQASKTIQDHPLLPNVKRLHIRYRTPILNPVRLRSMADEAWRLFKSMGPLDELTLHGCDTRSWFAPFLVFQEFEYTEQPIALPLIKELTISHPLVVGDEEGCMAAIVELAKSRHALGIPFRRVTVRAEGVPAEMAEMLGPWVGDADCHEEPITRAHSE